MGQVRQGEEGQAGLVVMALALLIAGVGLSIQLGLSFESGPDHQAATGAAGSPLVAPAADIQAKSTLSSALGAAQSSVEAGDPVSLADLTTRDAGVTFTGGPSTGPGTVSVSATTVGGIGPVTPTSEAFSLAVRSDSGTCWYVWTDGAVPWYGAQLNQHSCQAPALISAPQAGTPSSSTIGWQEGGYPPT